MSQLYMQIKIEKFNRTSIEQNIFGLKTHLTDVLDKITFAEDEN